MDLDRLISELSLAPEHRAVLEPGWQQSGASFPGADLPVLHADAVAENARRMGLNERTVRHLQHAAGRVRASRALARLFWHCAQALQLGDRQPDLDAMLGQRARLHNLLLAVSQMPAARAIHRRLGVPERICRATYADAALWCDYFREHYGGPGISTRVLGWLQNHLKGRLYRLGRLQFMLRGFQGSLTAFRNRTTGHVVALAADGVPFNSEGLFDAVDGVTDQRGRWTSRLVIDGRSASGNPISPLGHAIRQTVTLPAERWAQVLGPDDRMLDIHIPAGEPMTLPACRDSIDQALEFFPRYFPDQPYGGLMCHAWLLDPRYDGLLADTSNIVCFQREFYLFPTADSGTESLRRIFGPGAEDTPPDDLPADTTMRQAVLAHLRAGGRLRGAGAFYLNDELPWGRQVYRKAALSPDWPPV